MSWKRFKNKSNSFNFPKWKTNIFPFLLRFILKSFHDPKWKTNIFPFYWASFSKVSMTQSEKQIYFPFYWASFSKVLLKINPSSPKDSKRVTLMIIIDKEIIYTFQGMWTNLEGITWFWNGMMQQIRSNEGRRSL